jgi:hypothetical protein
MPEQNGMKNVCVLVLLTLLAISLFTHGNFKSSPADSVAPILEKHVKAVYELLSRFLNTSTGFEVMNTSATFQLRISSVLRYLRPEQADDVIADPASTAAAALASALAWTRKREAKIQHQANILRAELEALKFSPHPSLISNPNATLTSTLRVSSSQSPQQPINTGASTPQERSTPARISTGVTKGGFCSESGSSLRALNTSDPSKFRVAACIHDSKVGGVVRIEKLVNCDETVPFTSDAAYEADIRGRFGPDEFVLGLEGPELHSLTLNMQYRGKCVYDLPFHVTIPGMYHLNLVWYRENYVGAREGSAGWLPVHVEKPLGEQCFLNLTTSADADESESDPLLKHLQARTTVPPCDLHDVNIYSYLPGRWVFRGNSSADILHKGDAPLYHREADGVRLHTWVRLEDYTWEPNKCALPVIAPEHAWQCLKKKRIQFEGDSHLRVLYTALLEYVCGSTQAEWGGWESQCGAGGWVGGLVWVWVCVCVGCAGS